MPLAANQTSLMLQSAPKHRARVENSSNQAHERSQHREERSRSHSQPGYREPLLPQTANPRVEAASLRVDVPNNIPNNAPSRSTHLKHQTSQSTLDEQENGYIQKTGKQELVPRPPSRGAYPMYGQNNDDTTEITTSEGGWDGEHEVSGEPTAIHKPVQRSISQNDARGSIDLGPHWQREADAERVRKGLPPKFRDPANSQPKLAASHHHNHSVYSLDDDEDELSNEDLHELRNDTPSRAIIVAPVKAAGPQRIDFKSKKQVQIAPQSTHAASMPTDDGSSSPLPTQDYAVLVSIPQEPQLQQSNLARHRDYKQHLPLVVPPQESPKPAKNPNHRVSKVSAYYEASEEEQVPEPKMQPPEIVTKRSHADIDYDLEELKSKNCAALDQVPFLTDPRAPDAPVVADTNGNLMPLPQRLTRLKMMRPEDQASLFESLTDEDNETVGQWFVQQFQDSLKKLMERRLDRRKLALKFELEARKRETEVQAKTSDVDEELKQLRKGGGELIRDKSVGAVGGTPRKE